jgi:hypothetical protein
MPECDTCVICQEDFCESKRHVITLHCGHKFHKTCAREWLKSHASCPMCRGFAVGKITRTLSPIYHVEKLTQITTLSMKLYMETDNDKIINLCKSMIKIYLENPYIFVSSNEVGELLKNMMITINDIILEKVEEETPEIVSLTESLNQTRFMLNLIY